MINARSYGKALAGLLKGLNANRITIYLTAIVNITGAVYSVAASLPPAQVGAVVGALAGINGLAIMFLKGWQQFEAAMYHAESIQYQVNAQQQAQAAATAPRSAVKLPR